MQNLPVKPANTPLGSLKIFFFFFFTLSNPNSFTFRFVPGFFFHTFPSAPAFILALQIQIFLVF